MRDDWQGRENGVVAAMDFAEGRDAGATGALFRF
jgi:hypothetical protein